MKYSILVVEDSRAARDGLVKALDQAGFVGIPAANGREALDYLQAGGGASVILLDAMLPDMDGWTFRRAQQADIRLAHIPVVVVSALDERPIRGLSPDASFRKPVDVQRLLATISDLCGVSAPQEAAEPDPPPRLMTRSRT